MARNPQWRNVSAGSVGNGAAYFNSGASLINQAFKAAEDGISKYQEQEKENANTREANNTAKLLDIAKVRPLTQKDYDAAGMVDRTTLNKMQTENDKLNLEKKKTAAQIAGWNATTKAKLNDAKMSPMQKLLIKDKMEKGMLDYKMANGMMWNPNSGKSNKSGKGGDVMNIAKDVAEAFDVPLNQAIAHAAKLAEAKKVGGTQLYNEMFTELGAQVDHDAFRQNDLPGNWGSMF